MASFTLNLTLVGIRTIHTTHTKSKSKTYPKKCFRDKDCNSQFIKITLPLLYSLPPSLPSTLNWQTSNQSEGRTSVLSYPLCASQSQSREIPAVSSVLPHYDCQNSDSHQPVVPSVAPNDGTYKFMPLLPPQTFLFSPSLTHYQGRFSLEQASWNSLDLSPVIIKDVDRRLLNVPNYIQCLPSKFRMKLWSEIHCTPSWVPKNSSAVSSSLKSLQLARMWRSDDCKLTLPVIGFFSVESILF